MSDKTLRIGSRKSELALIQTNHVMALLQKAHPGLKCEIVKMSTMGDQILDIALSKIGEKSLFTRELEQALETKKVDLVVHSLKDLPTTLPSGMIVGAILERDDPHDAVVLHPNHQGSDLKSLPKDSVIGTSSLRRAAQLKRNFPSLQFESVRGNLNTRLRKLDEDQKYAALILAAAGLKRMGWQERISHTLTPDECMYAVSQGALGVEIREDDTSTLKLLEPLNHVKTLLTCVAERSFMRTLEGGCSVPVAVSTSMKDNLLTMKGGVYNLDGTEAVEDTVSTALSDPDEPTAKKPASEQLRQFSSIVCPHISQDALQQAEDLGKSLAAKLAAQGADEILRVVKEHSKKEIQKAHEERQKAKLAATAEPKHSEQPETEVTNGKASNNGSKC